MRLYMHSLSGMSRRSGFIVPLLLNIFLFTLLWPLSLQCGVYCCCVHRIGHHMITSWALKTSMVLKNNVHHCVLLQESLHKPDLCAGEGWLSSTTQKGDFLNIMGTSWQSPRHTYSQSVTWCWCLTYSQTSTLYIEMIDKCIFLTWFPFILCWEHFRHSLMLFLM